MLNLYKLEIFAHVVRQGSFSGAAQHLAMTQSGISQHMNELEQSLGVQLFARTRRGVKLTLAGDKLNEYTQRIFMLVAEAENAVVNVEQLLNQQIIVGATPGLSAYLLPEWMQGFRLRYPKLTVSLQTGITTQIVADVLAHRLDIGFIEGELGIDTPAQLGRLGLQEVNQVVVVGARHPWRQVTEMRLQQLHKQAMVMRQPYSQTRIWLDGVLREHELQPQIVAEFDHLESIKRAVINGAGLAILPEYAISQEVSAGLLHRITLEGNPLCRVLKMIWDRQNAITPVSKAFLTHLQITFPQIRILTASTGS